MRGRVSFPSYKILFLLPPPIGTFFDYLFDFPFFFAFNNVRWWFDKIGTVLIGFFVRRKKGGVEYIVYFPGGQEAEFVSDI